jgi:uncharacterized membrane protein YgcG
LAASLVRIVATVADEQPITLPREDQVKTWFDSWVSSGALRPLLPLIVDNVLDIEKVKSVINAMLLLRTVSPSSSPEPKPDSRQQEEAPASPDLDPFKTPPHTPLQPRRVAWGGRGGGGGGGGGGGPGGGGGGGGGVVV